MFKITNLKKNNKIKAIFIILFFLIFIFIFSSSVAYADEARMDGSSDTRSGATTTTSSVDIKWYQNNQEVLTNNSIILDALHYIGWGTTSLACKLAGVVADIYDKTFGLIDVTQYSQINSMLTKFKGVLIALTIACTAILGFLFILQKEKKPIIRNILMAMLAVSCSTYVFTTANTIANGFKGEILGESKNQAYSVVNENIIDITNSKNMLNMDYKNNKCTKGAEITNKNSFNKIDINQTLCWYHDGTGEHGQDAFGWSDEFNDYLKYSLTATPSGDKLTKVDDGITSGDILNDFYYRYHFDFFSCILELIAICVLYLSLAYKNIRIAYELIMSRIMGTFFASEIHSGERLKQILFFIRDTYFTLCVSILSIKLYTIILGAIPTSVTGLARGIIAIFIAYVVIDGPNLVERVLGMDAGLRSSMGRAMAVVGMGKTALNKGLRTSKKAKDLGVAAATGKTFAQRTNDRGSNSFLEGKLASIRGNKKKNSNKNAGDIENDIIQNENENIKHQVDNNDMQNSNIGANFDSINNSDENANLTSKLDETEQENPLTKNHVDTTFMDTNTRGSNDVVKTSKTTKPQRQLTEAGRLSKELAPNKQAPKEVRDDWNRQMNNVMKGKSARKPRKNADDYKHMNYKNALKVEKAYKNKGKK